MSGYAIDSNGNAVAINNAKQIQMVQPLENRRKELVKYVYQLTPLLQSAGLNVNTNQFTLLFSPNGILEKIVLFAKIPLQSNSPLVKQAFEASTHYDYPFQSNQQKAFLKSIYCIQVNYKPTWWYVSAEVITLERNIIDGIWISAKKEASIPYYAFQSKYQLKSVEQPIQSPQTFWCISLTGESLPDNVNDLFPLMAQIPSKSTILADAVSKVNQNIGISAKDSNSNQNPDFHRAMQRIIKAIDKTSAYQAASLPNPKAEEMKRAGDVVSRSFQSKSKYSALNQERIGVMQEWYKAAILMGAATELGDTALRNSAMQIMQNVVEGHTGSQKGFKNMVELMEKSETYKMEMARFQAKDLKEIFSQDCTQEMRGSKDNNTLFQDAIRNLAGRIGGAEAMTAIAAAQHFQQEQVEKELQAQKQERKPKKSYGKSGSEERT